MNKSKVLMGLLIIIGILTFSCGDDKGDDKGTINVDIDGHDDNTYTFKTTADTSFCPFERELIFNSFELNDHSGTFIYAMTSYDYTATKR